MQSAIDAVIKREATGESSAQLPNIILTSATRNDPLAYAQRLFSGDSAGRASKDAPNWAKLVNEAVGSQTGELDDEIKRNLASILDDVKSYLERNSTVAEDPGSSNQQKDQRPERS